MKIDLDQECDPPCFTAGLRKKKAHEVWTRVPVMWRDARGVVSGAKYLRWVGPEAFKTICGTTDVHVKS